MQSEILPRMVQKKDFHLNKLSRGERAKMEASKVEFPREKWVKVSRYLSALDLFTSRSD